MGITPSRLKNNIVVLMNMRMPDVDAEKALPDTNFLELLQTTGGQQSPEIVADRVRGHLKDIALQLAAIATAIKRQNERSLQRATQVLRAIGANLSANRLAHLYQELEIVAPSDSLLQASQKMTEIKVEHEKVCQAWQQVLQQPNLESSRL